MDASPSARQDESDFFGYREHDRRRLRPAGDPAPRALGDTARSEFQRDYDRLVFSGAYRRLQGKTQVVSPSEADFFRNRLTHTIEVTQVARRMAEMLNVTVVERVRSGDGDGGLAAFSGPGGCVDPDVCAAASALHDLGHPPFGHAGEQALGRAVQRLAVKWRISDDPAMAAAVSGGFNGNAQSLRMAVHSLTHKTPGGGLELTRAVLDGMLKYPWTHAERPKGSSAWSLYPTETDEFAWIRDGVPDVCRTQQSIEAQIVDWADDVAYAVHDLEDWYRAGYFPLDQLTSAGSPALEALCEEVARRWDDPDAPEFVRHVLLSDDGGFGAFRDRGLRTGPTIDPHGLAGREAMRQTRSALYDECFRTTSVEPAREADPSWSPRYAVRLVVPDEVRRKNRLLRDLLWIYLVGSHRLATQQTGQRRIVSALFDLHATAADPADEEVPADIFPDDVKRQVEETEGKSLERLRLVCDFIAGMTDSYAVRLHARLVGRQSAFHELV